MILAADVRVEDFATAAIDAKAAKCSTRRLAAIVGAPLAEFWRGRLVSLGTNQRGWPSTHFWERAARSVTHQATSLGVELVANHQGLRQRWLGGHIGPVKAKALAIPISPVSYGHSPSEFPELWLLRTPKGAYLVQNGLVMSEKTGRLKQNGRGGNSGRRIRAGLIFLFKLSSGVDQAGNPEVVPSGEEFAEVAMALIDKAVQ